MKSPSSFHPTLRFLGLSFFIFLFSCSPIQKKEEPQTTPIKVSFLLTNDIHGHLEPGLLANGNQTGGMAYLGSIVDSIRALPEYASNQSALFVLDSGDQFQGTLLSNYTEGDAVFRAMNEIGYDAAVPGNHDYDFGPTGWLYDRVTDGKTGSNPKEVIEKLARLANFPLLSANTYLKSSIRFKNSNATLELDSQCRLRNGSTDSLDFENAARPDFLKPYQIIKKAGVRVALIGIDNHSTATTTTIENVQDLCFRDEIETYLEIRKSLEKEADVFVLMIHNGNSDNSKEASAIVESINRRFPKGVHLAAAGHTHFIHNDSIDGVRVIQNGAETRHFGRVDLYFDPVSGTILSQATESKAGIPIDHTNCNKKTIRFCDEYPLPLKPKDEIQSIIEQGRTEISPLTKIVLGEALEEVKRNRINENALSNFLTDSLRSAANTQIAFMNTGGIRSNLPKGTIDYETLFEVLPFSNSAVIMNTVPWSVIKSVLTKSIKTCGKYGALMQSGLKIRFSRQCKTEADLDPDAKLIQVALLDGKILLDSENKIEIASEETFSVATLDFLASGGSGYQEFQNARVSENIGIAREQMVESMKKSPVVLTNKIDSRFENVAQ